jgi:MFS family permease
MLSEETPLLGDGQVTSQDGRDSSGASERRPSIATPLPWRSLSILLLTSCVAALAFELIFPFVNQMIYELGIVKDPKRIGYYSGFIESCFSITSLIAILPCAYLSDRIGRKPVVVVGMLGLSFSMAMFGLSQTFVMLVISRVSGGALSGTWAAVRTMITELTDDTNQGTAFALLSVCYRLGQIIGLPLGGLLAHPEKRFPLFQTPFWQKYPFALPCFVGASLAFLGFVLGVFLVDETLPSKTTSTLAESDVESITEYSTTDSEPRAPESAHQQTSSNHEAFSFFSVLTPALVSLLLNSIFMCLLTEMAFAVYPLFAYTPPEVGGLGISEAEIGVQMGFRAILHIAVTGLYPTLQRRLGNLRLYQTGLSLLPLVMLMFPTLNWLVRSGESTTGWLFLSILTWFFVIWSLFGLTWTSMFSLVVDSAPSPEAIATVNSLSQMSIVLPQAFAPASATSLFAYSLKTTIPRADLAWMVLFALSSLVVLQGWTLKVSSPGFRNQRKS